MSRGSGVWAGFKSTCYGVWGSLSALLVSGAVGLHGAAPLAGIGRAFWRFDLKGMGYAPKTTPDENMQSYSLLIR